MRNNFDNELTPEVREKMKKNLVYIGIFSIIMLFAGFTSAYIVSMGDSFWLKHPLPSGFYLSTLVIALSSLTFILALQSIKRGNTKGLKIFMTLTLVLGLFFVYFQFKGYGQLIDDGIRPANNHIVVTDGRYGDYYELKYKDAYVEVDGNNFLWKGKKMTDAQMNSMKEFMSQFLVLDAKKPFSVKSYGAPFELLLDSSPITLVNGQLQKKNGEELSFTDRLRLRDLAVNIRDGRGDFFVKGEMGKDFQIYYKGKSLTYKDRSLYFEGRKLENYLLLKIIQTSDTANSFLYMITGLHLLHIFVALIYLLRLTISSFSGRFTSVEYLGLKVGSIFWHFLGLLWLYLLLFLLFIH